jgi:hypothetical protein
METAITLEESIQDVINMRNKRKRVIARNEENGWIIVEDENSSFKCSEMDRTDSFGLLCFSPRCKKVDIFIYLLPMDLWQSIIKRTKEEDPKAFLLPNHKNFIPSMDKIYHYLAIRVRIQGFQKQPLENQPNPDAQRKAFQSAQQYFQQKYPKNPPPGLNIVEKLHSHLHITPKEEPQLSRILSSSVVQIGRWAAGDEKLFHFTGNSGWIRLVPNKPDHIGLWNYELTIRLSNGMPYLIYVRSHSSNSSVGEKIFTSEIVQQWGTIVKNKGSETTILVCDSYYLDTLGRETLNEMDVQFICGVQANRFGTVSSLVKPLVQKPGEFQIAWNDDSEEIFVCHWTPAQSPGGSLKKYVMSNAFKKYAKKPSKYYIPAFDEYGIMFKTCDQFNRNLHDATWPHRSGGGTSKGDLGALHDFLFSSILQNTMNAWLDIHSKSMDFKSFCTELADEIYEYANTIKPQ